jgi:hypothetical protein
MSDKKAEMTPSKRSNDGAKGQLRPFCQHPRAV